MAVVFTWACNSARIRRLPAVNRQLKRHDSCITGAYPSFSFSSLALVLIHSGIRCSVCAWFSCTLMHSPGRGTRLHRAHCPFENPLLASSLHYDVSWCWRILSPRRSVLAFRVSRGYARAFTYYSREHGTRAATLRTLLPTRISCLCQERTFPLLFSVSMIDEDARYGFICMVTLSCWRTGSLTGVIRSFEVVRCPFCRNSVRFDLERGVSGF